MKVRTLVRDGQIKIPEGVGREIQRKSDRLSKTLDGWKKKYCVVVELDHETREQLPEIERRYGWPFRIGNKTYAGFWQSASGRKSIDGQVVAIAKVRQWIVISNDDSVHGACMLERVICRRWEEIGRLLLQEAQTRLPSF